MLILFQGDSITDCGRRTSGGEGYETDAVGPGYPGLVKSRILRDNPGRDDIEFVNRAVSGNRTPDILARWRIDAINLKPDVVSILAGVNDSLHENGRNGVPPACSEAVYRAILVWTKSALPAVRFVLLEPFTFPIADGARYAADVAERAAFTRRLAGVFGATFIPLQSLFDEAMRSSSPKHWSPDGVHLTPAGHQLVADAWLEAVKL